MPQPDEPQTAFEIDRSFNVEWSVNHAINALDELIAFANNPETMAHLQANVKFVGMIKTRADLLVSFLEANKPARFKVISNG